MKNTIQSQAVLKAVRTSCDHPTAETIFMRAKADVPNISLGTVYRLLGLLSAEGKIKHIQIAGSADRYDKTISMHAHLHCNVCGAVVDIDEGVFAEVVNVIEHGKHVQISSADIMFKGICGNCLNKGEKNESII